MKNEEDINNLSEISRLKIFNLRNILIEECKRNKIHNPLNCAPKNNLDEIFDRCYLGDS